jgi:CubicO group peptidase (beta-lactamase class C family)
MNKLGILFLNEGVYKGKRIVSKEYVKMCSKEQIKTDGWGHYSNQFWMTPEGNGYRADGAYGQITFIWPDLNLTFSVQRLEDTRLDEFLKLLKEEVLNKL